MTLHLDRVVAGLDSVVARAAADAAGLDVALASASAALGRWASDPAAGNAAIEAAMAESDRPYATVLEGSPLDAVDPGPRGPVTVVAADGSSIDPDRFAPVQCFVVNVGLVVLPYSTAATARLDSTPSVGPSADEATGRFWAVPLRRDVAELEAAAHAAVASLAGGPVALLLDGTLFPWDLDSRLVDPDLRRHLKDRVQDALDLLCSCGETVSLGAYISSTRSADVATSLAVLSEGASGTAPALNDALVFSRVLGPGQRSAVFRARSQRVQLVENMFSPSHQACFFYLRVGHDLARVELPHWAATLARLERLHATLVDQCLRCDGYPRALQEAHEQAVISGGDRLQFSRLLDERARDAGFHPALNSKQMSKRRRAL